MMHIHICRKIHMSPNRFWYMWRLIMLIKIITFWCDLRDELDKDKSGERPIYYRRRTSDAFESKAGQSDNGITCAIKHWWNIDLCEKRSKFYVGVESETTWIHTIQVAEVGAKMHNYAIAYLIAPCDRMVVDRGLREAVQLICVTASKSTMRLRGTSRGQNFLFFTKVF